RWTVICSKRRAKVTPETLNQSAKKLKSSDKRINKQFFDPSTFVSARLYFDQNACRDGQSTFGANSSRSFQ
ncbi:hypothetical protein, partial [Gluconobacter sp. NFX36]|uniref:hypothetical protein n=1 Tax=Gluconobacter sp. NFX36 TaxID=2819535 RepID=UPI003CF50D1B